VLGTCRSVLRIELSKCKAHPTTHLRSSSQEVFDGHEGLFAAKANNGERFFLRLSKYLTSLYGVRVCQQL
jgi:hypothetical protein